jgi:hypothetical protein
MWGGYFAFVGESVNTSLTEQQVVNFTVKVQSGIPTGSMEFDDRLNRKLFKSIAGGAFKKKKRYVFASQLSSAEKLEAADSESMSMANTRLIFQVLSEITERAMLGLDFRNLNALIELAGVAKFLKVRGALATRKSMVVAVSDGIDELLRMLNANLGRMQGTAASEMNATDAQFIRVVKILMDVVEAGQQLAVFAKGDHHRRRPFDVALIVICILEFVSYVVFVLVRRHQLRNFKID